MMPLLPLAAAYLMGGVPFGYLIVKAARGVDLRALGSGNIGATNVLRTAGILPALLTLGLDIGKGIIAVWLTAWWSGGSTAWMCGAALAVMAGHSWPPFLRFKGGKAVASFVGAFGYIAPLPMAATVVVFLITAAVTRYISLGSILAAGTFPLGAWLIEHPPGVVILSALAAALLLIWRHRSNIARIRASTENVFTLRRGRR